MDTRDSRAVCCPWSWTCSKGWGGWCWFQEPPRHIVLAVGWWMWAGVSAQQCPVHRAAHLEFPVIGSLLYTRDGLIFLQRNGYEQFPVFCTKLWQKAGIWSFYFNKCWPPLQANKKPKPPQTDSSEISKRSLCCCLEIQKNSIQYLTQSTCGDSLVVQ